MKEIELALEPTNGYVNSFIRDTEHGWWILEVGLPNSWVFDENKKIGCEILFENEVGKLIKVFPKKSGIVIDDLITFVEIIIDTNKKIALKEKEFTDKMQEMKGKLEIEAQKYYQELDELKESSFKKVSQNFADTLEDKPKRGRPKGSTNKTKTPTTTETETVKD